jgi:hypothetical protein
VNQKKNHKFFVRMFPFYRECTFKFLALSFDIPEKPYKWAQCVSENLPFCRRDIHQLSMTLPVLEGTSVYKIIILMLFGGEGRLLPSPPLRRRSLPLHGKHRLKIKYLVYLESMLQCKSLPQQKAVGRFIFQNTPILIFLVYTHQISWNFIFIIIIFYGALCQVMSPLLGGLISTM